MALDKYEKINLALLVGGGISLAILSIAFRLFVDRGRFGINDPLFNLQYTLSIVILATLILLLWKSNREIANYAYAVMTFTFGIGLLFPPATITFEELIISLIIAPLFIAGGIYHYRFNNGNNTIFIGILAILAHQFYLFGLAYMALASFETGQYLILIVGGTILTVILYSLRQILSDELEKTKDDSRFARVIMIFLSPTR